MQKLLRPCRRLREGALLVLVVVTLAYAVRVQADPPSAKPAQSAAQKKSERLLELYVRDAEGYTFYRDAVRKEKLDLRKKSVYNWLNPVREGGQQGSVFIWTYRGRPEVLGSIFSNPTDGGKMRVVFHEFHTLSPQVIFPERNSSNQWRPQAGITLTPMANAPQPAASAKQRTIQLRSLSREFSAHSVDHDRRTWELRVLPQPLYRYESEDPEVIDGAVLAFVTNAGTDPEVLLLLEARQVKEGPRWHYGLARFSDFSLYVKHKDVEVWSAVRDTANPWDHDELHRYRIYREQLIPEFGEDEP